MVDRLIIISGQKEFSTEFLATEKLIKEACKNILIIINRCFLSSSQYRLSGYKKGLKEYNVDFNRENVLILHINNSKVKKFKEAVPEKYEDGIFAINDQLIIEAMEALSELNLKIPQDAKIIGFDNDSFSKYTNPPLTTIY